MTWHVEAPLVLGVDPGTTETAWVELDTERNKLESFGKCDNHAFLEKLRAGPNYGSMAIEMIASYGMAVGAEVFETCVWIGRFIEAWGGPFTKVYRREVKMFLCGNNSADDSNIRQALIDRYGGKDAAIGKKKSPGPLYGISGDMWAALGVAVTWQHTHAKKAA